MKQSTIKFSLKPFSNHRLAVLCGQYDENLRQIERHFGVEINNRANLFELIGAKDAVKQTKLLLQTAYKEAAHLDFLEESKLHLLIKEITGAMPAPQPEPSTKRPSLQTQSTVVKARSENQIHYLENIAKCDINFGIGPSGTGKTYLAVAAAIAALEKDEVRRLVLVRPAVEAGEKLGFLPGDMAEKVDPYLRPLYDALFEIMGVSLANKLISRDVIEVAPLAFMRGRTLSDAFIILDESQNTTEEQMKMFLTRIGFGSKAVITGDITQIDLAKHQKSGLRHAIEVLKDIAGISFSFFLPKDVVRHPLVQEVIEAYEKYDQTQS